MPGLNIVFVASEASPLAKTGGLADVVGSLPHALKRLGHDVTVILPFYRRHICINDITLTPFGTPVHLSIDGVERWVPLHSMQADGLDFILIEQDDLFDRGGLYGPAGSAYDDNPLRFTLFTRAAIEAAGRFQRPVDIFHCHDWQTAILPLLLRRQYLHLPQIAASRCIYTIHNLAYQGVFPPEWVDRLDIPADLFHPEGFEFHGQVNFMKAGILMSDHVTTVSETYAEEILTPAYGWGLEGFLRRHRQKVSGIVNGLDIATWDPATDPFIAKNFSIGRMQGKQACKADLQLQAGITETPQPPLLAMVSRLAEQKGVDLLIPAIPNWLREGCQLVILGSGDPAYEGMLRDLAELYPEQMHFYSGFNEALAHRIYAGADIFLMPSRFEPCGLSQLMAMRYGTIPVARATGGLKDTVLDYDDSRTRATGFTFAHADPEDLERAVKRALNVYATKAAWRRLVSQAMRRDSSWDASAQKYLALYELILREPIHTNVE